MYENFLNKIVINLIIYKLDNYMSKVVIFFLKCIVGLIYKNISKCILLY